VPFERARQLAEPAQRLSAGHRLPALAAASNPTTRSANSTSACLPSSGRAAIISSPAAALARTTHLPSRNCLRALFSTVHAAFGESAYSRGSLP
jgi:hypothetical protein